MWLGDYSAVRANLATHSAGASVNMAAASVTPKIGKFGFKDYVVDDASMQGLQHKDQWHDHQNIQLHSSLQKNPQRKVHECVS